MLRALIFVAPLVAALIASLWLSTRLFEPTSAPMVIGWWAILIGASSVVAWAVDRFGRRFLPLTVLLRATMLFPDRAPSRYKLALRTSNVRELRRRVAEADKQGETDLSLAAELVLSLATALNKHDRKTRGHGERTRAYADILAEELKVPEEGRDKLRWAALLHDIGKLSVSPDILNKEGPLDDEELAIMRRHPLMGMRVAAPIVPWLGEWAGAIEHHHERWDGSGYPRGLEATDISLAARIVSVADAYDVMTSGRSYQKAMNADEARQEVAREAGGQFDPTVVRALMNVSLGRLRWVLGPMASLGPIPFFLDRIGRDFLTLSTAATVTAAAVVSGALPIPAPTLMPPPAVTVEAQATRLPTGEVFDQTSGRVDLAAAGIDTSNPSTTTTTPDPTSTTTPETTVPARVAATTADPSTTTTSTTTTTVPKTTAPPAPTTAPPTTAPPTTIPPPTANPDVVSMQEDGTVMISVLNNDTPTGLHLDALTSTPKFGTVTVNGNRIGYTPNANANGTDTFGYRACDSAERCATTTVAVQVAPVNDPPTVRPDGTTTNRGVAVNIAVLANDTDPDGDQLTVQSVTSPAHGSATTNGSRITYTPAPGYAGTDSFSYRACDASNACGTASVSVTVVATNSPPNAADDTATTARNQWVRIRVLDNDSDPDGNLDPSTLTVTSGPQHERHLRIRDGQIDYQPNPHFIGTDTFTYRVCDTQGACDTAVVTVTVTRR